MPLLTSNQDNIDGLVGNTESDYCIAVAIHAFLNSTDRTGGARNWEYQLSTGHWGWGGANYAVNNIYILEDEIVDLFYNGLETRAVELQADEDAEPDENLKAEIRGIKLGVRGLKSQIRNYPKLDNIVNCLKIKCQV